MTSPTTVAKWKNKASCQDASSAPHTRHYTVDSALWVIIKKVRKNLCATLDDIVESLNGYIPALNRANCYRILAHYNLNRLSLEQKKQNKQFASYDPGFIHIDFFHLPRLNGKRYYCFLAIDRATRLICLKMYDRRRKEEAADFLLTCLNFFPFRIHHILTDNGREFTMRGQSSFGVVNDNPVLFEALCALCGIKHRRTKPAHPWTNGLAERLVRTTRENTCSIHLYDNASLMRADLVRFQRQYNTTPKRVLGGKTPLEVAEEWYQSKPEIFFCQPAILSTMW